MKKFATMAISTALIGTMALGGSLAYLHAEDSDVNTMTLGNVKITQNEYQRVKNADGTYAINTAYLDPTNGNTYETYTLENFTQDKPLLPTTEPTNHGAGGWDETVVRMAQADSYGFMQVFESPNAVDKFVTVKNTGETDAYVRTLVAIEVGSTDGSLIGSSSHKTWNETDFDTTNTTDADPLYVLIDGRNYMVKEFVYAGGPLSGGTWRHENGILPADDTSYPNLSQVYIQAIATNEDMQAIDGNGNGTLDILVLSQAVQAAGFDNATEAFNAAFPYGTNNENVVDWFEDIAPTSTNP